MRKLFATSAVVATVLSLGVTGLAGSAAASPPDEPLPLDEILDVLEPEQFTCIAEQITQTGADPEDPAGALAALEECGVSMDQLMDIASGQQSGGDVPISSDPDAAAGGATDPAVVAAVLAGFGLDSGRLTCLAEGLAVTEPGDDDAALAALQECGVSLSELLTAMAAEPTDAAAETTPTTTSVADDAAAEPTTETGDEMMDSVLATLESMGIELTEEQAECLADQVTGGIDTADITALMDLLSSCDISITDLLGG